MRTQLIRVITAIAGVVLSGVSFAVAAHAAPGDDPAPNVVPCEQTPAEILAPVGPEPSDQEIVLVPCYQIPADPPDDGDDEAGDDTDEPTEDDGDEPDGDGGETPPGDTDQPTSQDGPADDGGHADVDPSGGSGADDSAAAGTADDPTPEPDPQLSSPTGPATIAATHDGDDNTALVLLAGGLGALGLAVLGYGLAKRRYQ